MPRRSVTSYDIAKAAGVSQSAVSRAFSADAPISEKTRQRILNVAAEMGYQPNAIARSMSSARQDLHQKSGMVGIIVTRLEDPFFAHTIAQFSRNLQASGWHMLLFTVDTEAEVDGALNALMQYKVDSIIILSAILSRHMAQICRDRGTPVMLYNRGAEGLDVNSVQIENHEGGRIAGDILREAGHERIAFVAGNPADETSRGRKAGLAERLAEDGLEIVLHEIGDYTFAGGREAGLRLFSRAVRPDAVFCASDVMALGVLHAARHDLGLDAPRDFSLIGFDDIPAAAWPGHKLTTIRQPIRQMIREAVDVVIDQMNRPDQPARVTRFAGALILRSTVRRAATDSP